MSVNAEGKCPVVGECSGSYRKASHLVDLTVAATLQWLGPMASPAPSQTNISTVQSFCYKRRVPEEATLYKVVQENWPTFLDQIEDSGGLPDFVKKEFEEYLKCGILAHGSLRVKCGSCKHERLVGFSCKRRGFCPSCGAKRMCEHAALLVDHVIPEVPIRQWVISLPFQIRYLLAAEPKAMGEVLKLIHRAISGFLIKKSGPPEAGHRPTDTHPSQGAADIQELGPLYG